MEWIRVEDALPGLEHKGQPSRLLLVAVECDGCVPVLRNVTMAFWHFDSEQWRLDSKGLASPLWTVTHWMEAPPLPAPQEETMLIRDGP